LVEEIWVFGVHVGSFDRTERFINVEIEVGASSKEIVEANRTVEFVQLFSGQLFVLGLVIEHTQLFESPWVFVVDFERKETKVFLDVGMIRLGH
jgi:hypothetical protein